MTNSKGVNRSSTSARYTVYPKMADWANNLSQEEWLCDVRQTLKRPESTWSLYIHLPFCESLCTYCGCTVSITSDHSREQDYLSLIQREWLYYLEQVPELKERTLNEIYLGGGSPTFFSAQNLDRMLGAILDSCNTEARRFRGSIEIDPRDIKEDQIDCLVRWGFNRAILGIQDFDPEVQKTMNRVLTYQQVADLMSRLRRAGFNSIQLDLIYGFPTQDARSLVQTVKQILNLNSERIVGYPFVQPRGFKMDRAIPLTQESISAHTQELGTLVRSLISQGGKYLNLGLDTFVTFQDELYKVFCKGNLDRNLLGYTDRGSELLLGLGVSAISQSQSCLHQNEKILPRHERYIKMGQLAQSRSHRLNQQEFHKRSLIQNLFTKHSFRFLRDSLLDSFSRDFSGALQAGELSVHQNQIQILEKGVYLMPVIASYLDNMDVKMSELWLAPVEQDHAASS